jgi:hypothetical protein
MSAKNAEELEADEMMSRCASCGAGGDDIKLRKCTACYLVRYCGVKCQKEHRPKHKKECRKRAAELRDELLFKQPESSHFGDCPICLIPLPLDSSKSTMTPCCSKFICNGCDFAYKTRMMEEERLQQGCPFCRHPALKSSKEAHKIVMKRAEANDPVALREIGMGMLRSDEGDCGGAFEYVTKAAEQGDAVAHNLLSCLYHEGKVVEKDEKKEVYHLEQAAIGGHTIARHNLGVHEAESCRYERARRHFIINANLGEDISMKELKSMYQGGLVSKDDFASTLRAHRAAVDAMKSPDREAAEADVDYCTFLQNNRIN